LRFRSPAEVYRSTPAPSRRPEGLHVGRCFLSWTFAPYDTCRDSGSAFHGASGPAACHVRGFDTPIAAYTVVPPDAFRRRSVPRLHPSRPSPRRDPGSSRSPMPSWRCPRRFASPPCGACGRGRLQGFDPATGSFCPSESRRTRRADAFLGFIPPEHSLPPALASALGRGGSPRTRWAVRRPRPACVAGSSSTEGSVGPSRGYRLSWALPPFDCRSTAGVRTGSGRMVSPHGSRALQAARTALCSLATDPAGAFAPARRRRPSVNGHLLLHIRQSLLKPDEGISGNPSRSYRGFSGGATRTDTSRRPGGPLLGLRGAPGTQTRPR